jgi:2-oxo-4-hydroxy-4-carboxy-5-ureidoimidazoline decarboxylase
VRDLPRKLTVQELADLFQARSRFVEALAEVEDPLARAREVLAGLPEEQRVEALAHHPRIGERKLTGRSAEEQGAPAEEDPEVMAELAELNAAYEERFGFRFVVFVNRRPRAEIVPVLRERLERTREEELETGCDELVAIAVDRWRSS